MSGDWRRAVKTFQAAAGKTADGRAILVAVIGQAVIDLAAGDRGAAVYFLSDHYRRHLQQLGLSDELLPAGVTRAGLWELVEGPATTRPRRRSVGRGHELTQNVTDI